MKTLRLLFLTVAAIVVFTGCQTTAEQTENVSERPWNAQKGWEHGLPTGINQGR
jgi:uncharacterized lipoprotein YajG